MHFQTLAAVRSALAATPVDKLTHGTWITYDGCGCAVGVTVLSACGQAWNQRVLRRTLEVDSLGASKYDVFHAASLNGLDVDTLEFVSNVFEYGCMHGHDCQRARYFGDGDHMHAKWRGAYPDAPDAERKSFTLEWLDAEIARLGGLVQSPPVIEEAAPAVPAVTPEVDALAPA